MVVALLGGASPVLATGAPAEGARQARIESKVLDQISAQDETTFWVVLREQAELAPAHGITNRAARGRFVFDRLNGVASRSQARLRGLLRSRGVRHRPFWIVNTIEVTAGRDVLDAVAALPEVAAIEADRVYKLPDPVKNPAAESTLTTEWGLNAIRAPEVWSTFGVRGEDIVVANIDSGVRYTHDAVRLQYRGRNSDGTYDHNYNWHDPSSVCGTPSLAPCDNNDHGTHTMGTMVGDDAGTNQVGVAPRAKWIAAKGCESNTCSRPALLSSAQFILAPTDLNGQNPQPALRPHIVNNSWGSADGADTWYRASVQAWVASGIFPSFSNGNSGPGCGTGGAPASYPESFGVGAFAENGTIASFSSRGPSDVDGQIKPQVAAPGVAVRSATADNDTSYGSFNGTSMAAPHVSGTVALMWSAAPALARDIAATRTLLAQTAVDTADLTCGGTAANNNVWGEGKLDAFAAVDLSPRGPTGTLTGTITNAATSAPIAGATVTATGPATRTTTTNASGQYSLLLAPGTYSVTASARAYVDQTANDIVITQDTTTTQDFSLTGLPILVHEETTAFDADGDGAIEPGESFGLEELIRNTGVATATGVTGVLTSQTPGLTITQSSSAYPDIAAGTTESNTTTYEANVADSVPCGTPLEMQLDLTTAQGNFSVEIQLLTCELRGGPIQIPDSGAATPYPSTINVAGFGTNITDVDVRLNGLTHTEPDDLDLLLVGPTGQTATVMSDVGGAGDVTDLSLTLDDQAPSSLDNLGPLVPGTFRPTNATAGDAFAAPAPAPSGNVYLSAFNGTDPNGAWSLYVVDDLAGDLGAIADGWSLVIKTGPEPPPPPPCPPDCASDAAILIPDGPATPYPSSITYAGEAGATITDVNLQLNNITHTEPDDLDLLLVGPTGQTAIVMSDVGGTTDANSVSVTLDDQAPGSIPDAGPLVGGAFRPTNSGSTVDPFPAPAPAASGNVYLSAFNGTNPNGTWHLYVADDVGADWGEIRGGWSLTIETGTPPPPPPCPPDCANAGTILIPDGPATPYPSSVTYNGEPDARITDVNLQLTGLTHTGPDDLDLLLVGPTGQTAIVVSDVGGTTAASGVSLTLDDQAPASIPDSGPLASGTFKPTNAGASDPFPAPAPAASGNVYLSAFNGTDPNGPWRLYVADDASADWGEITGGWSLAIQTGAPPPPPPPCPPDCVNPAQILIPDGPGTPYPSSVSYSGNADARITDVNVQLTGLMHTEPDDLDLLLVGPTGRSAIVMSDVGGTTDASNVNLTLDDQAASHLGDSTALASGTFKPTNAGAGDTFPAPAPAPSGNVFLSTFNGTNPNGTWRLYVADDLSGDWGEITGGWSLVIETGAPPPPPPPCPPDCVNATPMMIPDGPATPYPSGITYAGPSGVTITDVNVQLRGLTHTEADDLDLLLVGPTGVDAIVMSDAGGTTDVSDVTLTIDDQAALLLPDSTVLTTGSFRPTNHGGADTWPAPAPPPSGSVPLSVFNGTNANGTWNLYVVDDLSGDWGQFTGGWSLMITTTAPPPSLAIDNVSMSEGNSGTTEFEFTVTKTGATDLPATVDFATANGTATEPGDYAAESGTLTFAAEETSKTISVLVNGDMTFEADETFTVNLTNATGATIADGSGLGTIENDDAAPTLTISNVSHAEGNLGVTAFVFTVTKSSTDSPAIVDFATADGSATEPGDYTAAFGTLSFAEGEATKTITVLVNGETTFEANETFTVNLTNPTGATIADGEGQGTIQNDDAAPTLAIDNVRRAEGNAGTTSFVFTVTKTGATASGATVDFASANGTATAPGDYASQSGTLSFAADESTKTITMLVNGDAMVELDETFVVNLSNANGATIADGEGVGTIENDDAPTIVLSATGRKEGNEFLADLAWTGAQSERVDIYRNGAWIITTANDGAFTDALGKQKKGTTFVYRVCQAGTQFCSNEAAVGT